MKLFARLVLCLLLIVFLTACDKNRDPLQLSSLRPNDVLLAFGDSLTLGKGAPPELSYPAQLSRLLSRQVINAGVAGETSAEGARRLPGLLDKYEPDLLLLCHGGNDILQRLGREQLRTNLRRMYEAAQQRDIEVVMIAVPQLGLLLEDVKVYRQLASELQIPLLEGALAELLSEPGYRSDQVHLNAPGYRKLAEAVADLLLERGAL